MTQIVGILRYSVLSTIFNPFKRSKRLSLDDYVGRILAGDRLHRRRILLETMVLPSLDAQTDRDFKLLIVAPRLLPKREKAQLEKHAGSRDYVRIVYVHESKFRMRHLSPLIIDEMVTGDGAFLTFRIDDDDAVADSYVARMRRYIDPAFDDKCVSLCRGQLVDIGTTADAIGIQPTLLPNASVGLGYVSTRAAPRTIFDVTDRHHRMHKRRPVITDGREDAFILTTHGENDTGTRRLLAERNLPADVAQRQLHALGFHVDLRHLTRRLGKIAAATPPAQRAPFRGRDPLARATGTLADAAQETAMTAVGQDTLGTRSTIEVDGRPVHYYSLAKAAEQLGDISRLPFSMKVLLENLLRFEDGKTVTVADLQAMVQWLEDRRSEREIQYRPARVLMQDFTGVPCVVDLAAMRDAMGALGGDAQKINPLVPVHLVIDHSVMVDEFGTPQALADNMALEYERNMERYEFLKWGSKALDNFQVVPPGTGICHQVNLENLARTVWSSEDANGDLVAYPDTLVGTDSHTTMVNGLGVLGWGVGGIEAEAAMLGQPVSMLIPEVVGMKLTGALGEGVTATDLVLTVTQMLRAKGVVGRFVEFYGPGLDALTLADRATIANMAPEYGATCGFFPVDQATINYLHLTGRDEWQIKLVRAYAQAQGLWRNASDPDPLFTDTIGLDMATVQPSLAGPKRPQDRVLLADVDDGFNTELASGYKKTGDKDGRYPVAGQDYEIGNGDVVIAAITSCTNTSNPSVLVAAGLVARKAREKGLHPKPWVKTSLAPGSQVVTDYLTRSGLQEDLDAIGFNLVGYGCTTCIGNSGPLPAPISAAVNENDLVAAAVLSGNRNFEGRVSPDVRANYLASPPLVVAYALKGTVREDMTTTPLGEGKDGKPVFLKDVWPTNGEVHDMIATYIDNGMYKARYANVFAGDEHWRGIAITGGDTYTWAAASTYVQNPPYFEGMSMTPRATDDIISARPLAIFGDSITTDHISPAGSIKADSPAGRFLQEHGVERRDFNSYGARRGNHEVMMRGTFANIRIRNEMVPGVEGGITRFVPSGETLAIYDAAMRYKDEGSALVVIAGKEYGTGSSRDWAAKGTNLLGVRAVIAESFERIHRSNLVGMGVLPLQFDHGCDRKTLHLDGSETFTIENVAKLRPRQMVPVTLTRADGTTQTFEARCRIDTVNELEYFLNGGILPYVLRKLAA